MNRKLKARAIKVAKLQNSKQGFTEAQIKEVAEVHHLLTGKTTDCTSCNVYGFITEINKILIQKPLKINKMAKIQFNKNAASKRVIRHTKNGTIVINSDNLHEGDNAEFVAKNYPHLIGEVKAEPTQEPAKTETKTTTTTTAKK